MLLHPRKRSLKIDFVANLCGVLALAGSACGQTDSPVVSHRYLVVYRDGVIPSGAATNINTSGARPIWNDKKMGIIAIETGQGFPSAGPRLSGSPSDEAAIIGRLAAQPNVEYIVHDRIVTANHLDIRAVVENPTFKLSITPPYDTYYTSPQGWAVREVGGYGANEPGGPSHGPWDISTGKNVRIAILDSGVDNFHPDIAPNVGLNLTEIDQSSLPSACDDGSPQDQEGHGTWTASLAAGALGPGTGLVAGVAPSATILNIKVLQRMPGAAGNGCASGQAGGLLSWVIQGIQDAVTNHADVISMSLGITVDLSTGEGAGVKAVFDRVTYAAAQAGVVLVAAAGNDGYNLSNSRYVELPAQARGVLAVVASTNPACSQNVTPQATCAPGSPALAYYSNFGDPLNAVAAPGGSNPVGNDDFAVTGWIRGACSSGNPNTEDGLPSDNQHSFGCFNLGHAAYVQAIGTSASAPLVAGVAALLRAAHPSWGSDTIVNKIRSSASSVPTLPVPLVNAAAALGQQ